jgi:hypothetical protein
MSLEDLDSNEELCHLEQCSTETLPGSLPNGASGGGCTANVTSLIP